MALRKFMVVALAPALLAVPLGGCLLMQEKTMGEAWDETTTGTEIKTKLFGEGAFSRFGEVDVEVAGRFVLLSGRVPSEADKVEAERIAWTSRLVDEVANELLVADVNFGRDVNDRWITEQIRTRLIADNAVKGVNYNIQVFDGTVYLLGLAQNEDELRAAAESASRVKGVRKVVSYVKMRDRRAPPQLAAQPAPTPEPVTRDTQAPAPLTTGQPTQRGSDPYSAGNLPPPQPRSPNNSLGN